MAQFKIPLLFCCVLSVFLFTDVFADDISVKEEIRFLKERIQALEEKVAAQEKCMNDQKQCILEQDKKINDYESRLSQFDTDLHRQTGSPIGLIEGLELGIGGTMVMQGTNNVNDATPGVERKSSRADVSYSADITLGKEFKDTGGRAFLHLEAGQGSGLEDNLTLYSNVNRDAGDSEAKAEVTEFWYEQALFGSKLAVTFGKLDPTAYFDNNEAANDETTQFLSGIFRNSPVLEFPDNAAGARLAYMPFDWLELGYGVFDANGDWEELGDNFFNIGQVAFKTNLFTFPGNYRFYLWNNNADHVKWTDAGKTDEAAYGFGLSFDQKVNEAVTLFARYGWENPKVYNPEIKAIGDLDYSLEQSWSAGMQVEGKPWGRKKDVLAFAVGQVFASGDYKDYYGYRARPEGHLEAYYRIHVNDYLSISPDIQYIWNPFGKDISGDTSPVFIGGLRAQLDF